MIFQFIELLTQLKIVDQLLHSAHVAEMSAMLSSSSVQLDLDLVRFKCSIKR